MRKAISLDDFWIKKQPTNQIIGFIHIELHSNQVFAIALLLIDNLRELVANKNIIIHMMAGNKGIW